MYTLRNGTILDKHEKKYIPIRAKYGNMVVKKTVIFAQAQVIFLTCTAYGYNGAMQTILIHILTRLPDEGR